MVAAATALTLSAATSRADLTFNYSVGATAAFSGGGDTLTTLAYSDTVTFTGTGPENSQTALLNPATWVATTGATAGNYPINLDRTMTVTLVSTPPGQELIQSGMLSVSKSAHVTTTTFSVNPGSSTVFNFGSWLLTVTPDPISWSTKGGTPKTGLPESLTGTCILTAVPEPTTMVAGVGALGLVLLGMFRSKRSGVIKIGQ